MATITIGWRDATIPSHTPIPSRALLRTDALRRAIAHYGIERGRRTARRAAWRLSKVLSRLSGRLQQGNLEINTTNLCTAPTPWNAMHGLAVEVWYCVQGVILWDIALYASGNGREMTWRLTRETVYRSASRTDVLVRRIAAAEEQYRKERQLEQERNASAYIASLPEPLQALQQTCRATCIRVARDGLSVVEALHDVGGSMTSVVGHNGYLLPTSLAGQQENHDTVYHPINNISPHAG